MKLGECIWNADNFLGEAIQYVWDTAKTHGNEPVRVEIHSLDDPPWPTERPEGWGVGWWFRVDHQELIAIRVRYASKLIEGFEPSTGRLRIYHDLAITAFGPRAEAPHD